MKNCSQLVSSEHLGGTACVVFFMRNRTNTPLINMRRYKA